MATLIRSGAAKALFFALQFVAQGLGAGLPPEGESPRDVKAIVVAVSEYGELIDSTGKHEYEQPLFIETAEKFASHIEGIVGKNNVFRLYNQKANRDDIGNLINEQTTIGEPSLLIFYFCGHGFKMPEGAGSSQTFLALHGCDPVPGRKNAFSKSISLEDLANYLVHLPQRSYAMYIDACYSGGTPLAGMVAADQNNGLNYRGLMLSSTSRDARSFGGVFTSALIAEFQESGPDPRRTAGDFRQKVEDRLRQAKGYEDFQRPRIALGDATLPAGPLNQRHAFAFITVRNIGRRGFAVTLKEPNGKYSNTICDYQEGPPCFAFTLPAKKWNLVFQTGEKQESYSLDLTGRFFGPLTVDIDKLAGVPAKVRPESSKDLRRTAIEAQEFTRKQFAAYLDAVTQSGAPLEEYARSALETIAYNTPFIDSKPMLQDYVALNPPASDFTTAAQLIAKNEPIPITAEGATVAALLEQSKIGGNKLLSRYYFDFVSKMLKSPNDALAIQGLKPAKGEEFLTFQFTCGTKNAILAGDYQFYYETAGEIFGEAETINRVLSHKDSTYLVALDNDARSVLRSGLVSLVNDNEKVNLQALAAYRGLQKTSVNKWIVHWSDEYKRGASWKSLPDVNTYVVIRGKEEILPSSKSAILKHQLTGTWKKEWVASGKPEEWKTIWEPETIGK